MEALLPMEVIGLRRILPGIALDGKRSGNKKAGAASMA
jgi:hypothetical protein